MMPHHTPEVSSSNALSSIAEWDAPLQREVWLFPLATIKILKTKKLPDSEPTRLHRIVPVEAPPFGGGFLKGHDLT